MIIKNGHIMDPASGKSYFADIKITDGVIGKIATLQTMRKSSTPKGSSSLPG